jgi:hypothetical protein
MLLSGGPVERLRHETRHALVVAFCGGSTIALGIALAGLLTGRLAVSLPLAVAAMLVLLQDVYRYSAVSQKRPGIAAIWDGVWVLGSLAIFFLSLGPSLALWAWTLSAGVSMLGLGLMTRLWPRVRGTVSWLFATGIDRFRFGIEAGISSLTSLVIVTMSLVFIGLPAAAALRGAGTVLGPVGIAMSAIPLAVVPHCVRLGFGPRQTWRFVAKFAAIMSAGALAVGVVGAMLPTDAGKVLLGDSWAIVSPLLPITGIEYAIVVWLSCLFAAMRAQGMSKSLLTSRIIYATCSILVSAGAAIVFESALAIAVGLAISAAACTIGIGRRVLVSDVWRA